MEICQLKNSIILPVAKVQDIIKRIKSLHEAGIDKGDPIALLSLIDLLSIANEPNYEIEFDSMKAKLQEFHFLDVEGKMDKTTRDVVKCFSYRDAETETYKLNDDYIAKMLGDS